MSREEDRAKKSQKVRQHIEDSMAKAEEEHRRQLQKRRIELANQGVKAYQAGKMGDAIRNFHTYLGVLEDLKNTSQGGLHPGLFDAKEDLPELVLINGIYWDLVKLYDRTKSPDKLREFKQYLEKYVLFSKNMSYQSLSAEVMRKYIASGKPLHMAEFKNAYKVIQVSKCFVVSSLLDVTEISTLESLRAWRDGSLGTTRAGRLVIRAYYRVGPSLAAVTDRLPRSVRRGLGRSLDRLARRLR